VKLEDFMLRRLKRDRKRALTRTRILGAAELIDSIVTANDAVEATRQAFDSERADQLWKTPTSVRAWLELVSALWRARRIPWAQYVFFVGSAVEHFHEGRWLDDEYRAELGPLQARMRELEAAGEEDGPEHAAVNAEYETVLDRKLAETFAQLAPPDVAQIFANEHRLYEELRERGRRYVHNSKDYQQALRDLATEIYDEATRAAAAGTYRAAVTLLGASMEALLLLRCLRSAKRAQKIAKALPRRLRSRIGPSIEAWSFETLVEVCDRAGWLPSLSTELARYNPGGFAHSLRLMRNWIHPGREARERPWQSAFREDYDLALALYTLVATALARPRSIRRGA
jgi:hypothetical protein